MENIVSQEELDREAVKFASEHCQRHENGKPINYHSLYYGFKEGVNFAMKHCLNYKCYHCGKTTSDVIYVMIADKDNTVKQVPICKKCYNKLMKDNPDD